MVEPVLFTWVSARRTEGDCFVCGYDLTENVSGRCPECGTAIEEMLERRVQVAADGRHNVNMLLAFGWGALVLGVTLPVLLALDVLGDRSFSAMVVGMSWLMIGLAWLAVLFSGLIRLVNQVVWPRHGWVLWACSGGLNLLFLVAHGL